MRNFALLSAAVAGLAAAGPVAPEVDSLFNHPDVVPEQGLGARAVPAKCNADNCARAVTGTAKGLPAQSARSADCASFFQYTYVPPTFTRTVYFTPYLTQSTTTTLATTSTQTVTATTSSYSNVLQNQPARRAEDTGSLIIPSSVPAYASPCSGTVRFSSACACWGFSPVTQTAAAPTTVLTITAETVTTIEVATTTEVAQATATQTLTVGYTDNVPCGQQIFSKNGISYNVDCGQSGVYQGETYRTGVSVQNTFSDCLAWVDANYPYGAVGYKLGTRSCSAYNTWYTTIRNPDSNIVFAAHRF